MGSPATDPGRDDDEGPQHTVTISKGFWLFDTACTQALWQAVMGHHPSFFRGARRPVERVSWNDIQTFLERINATVQDLTLTLPTEAQWEYACRAGTTTAFNLGDLIDPTQANYERNYLSPDGGEGDLRPQTVNVATFPPNAWGLHEMHGNVAEWCLDGPRRYGRAVSDPLGPTEDGAGRVSRGGSWGGTARSCRSAMRVSLPRGVPVDDLGFRCARVQER